MPEPSLTTTSQPTAPQLDSQLDGLDAAFDELDQTTTASLASMTASLAAFSQDLGEFSDRIEVAEGDITAIEEDVASLEANARIETPGVAEIQSAIDNASTSNEGVLLPGGITTLTESQFWPYRVGGSMSGWGSGGIVGLSQASAASRLVAHLDFPRSTANYPLIKYTGSYAEWSNFCIDGGTRAQTQDQEIEKPEIGVLITKDDHFGINTGSIRAYHLAFSWWKTALQFGLDSGDNNTDSSVFSQCQFYDCDTVAKFMHVNAMRNDFFNPKFGNCRTIFHFLAGGKFYCNRGYTNGNFTGTLITGAEATYGDITVLFLDDADSNGIGNNNGMFTFDCWEQDSLAGAVKLVEMTPGGLYDTTITWNQANIAYDTYNEDDKRLATVCGQTDLVFNGCKYFQNNMFEWYETNPARIPRIILNDCILYGNVANAADLFKLSSSKGSCNVKLNNCKRGSDVIDYNALLVGTLP